MSLSRIQRTWLTVVFAFSLVPMSPHALSAPTPAQEKIESARTTVTASPGYQAYHDLARALLLRARESGDISFYAEAERALAQAALLAPDNLENESIAVSLLLAQREFGAALERARALNKKMPDEVAVYGHIVDAAAALGKYDEAERAAQWMLDLRSTAVLSLTRVAYLREVFGDTDGAIDLMQSIYPRIAPEDVEERAWHLVQMARMLAGAGRIAAAEAAALAALSLFPDYHHALAQLAGVRLMQGRASEAVALELKRMQSVRRPENIYALAKALAAAGREKEARLAFVDFEREALARTHEADNVNRELTLYYVDYARKPKQALAVAAREIERRRDVRTMEAYALALHANGRAADARRQIEAAMAAGICDAGLLRAGALAARPRERNLALARPACAGTCCGASAQADSAQTTRATSRAGNAAGDARRSPR